ncbi:MAG: phosphatase PAP2 family protein [Planctomycetaceae bacterium]
MSRDSRIKWTLIGLTVCACAALIRVQGLHFPLGDALSPLLIAGVLGAVAFYYHRQREESFVACANALLHVTLYTACYSVLMYAAAVLNRPLIDDWLMTCDALARVHVPDMMAWAAANPPIEKALRIAYNSLLLQTPLVIVILGFTGDRRSLEQFVLQFMVGTWICLVVFCLWPAAGPFSGYGFAPNATQARYLEHFHELREGVRTVVTWRNAEGLITFPSFHTTWALLLAWAVRKRPWLFVLSGSANAAVILATMTTGWHYFTDVAGGVLLGGVVIALTTHSAAELTEMSHGMVRRLRRVGAPAKRRREVAQSESPVGV